MMRFVKDSVKVESYFEFKDRNGKTQYVYEWDYDESGNEIAGRYYDSNGNLESSFEITYEYDSNGNLLKTTKLNKDSEGNVTKVLVTEYTYSMV